MLRLIIFTFLFTVIISTLNAQDNDSIRVDTAYKIFPEYLELKPYYKGNEEFIYGLIKVQFDTVMAYDDLFGYVIVGSLLKRNEYRFLGPDSIPKSYCECLDTNLIIGDKVKLFKIFEEKIIKANLVDLQSFNHNEYRAFFNNLFPHYQPFFYRNGEEHTILIILFVI